MKKSIQLFLATVSLLTASVAFADTGVVSCKTKVTYNDGSQENFRTFVNVHAAPNWEDDGFHFEGSRVNKFPSDSARALSTYAHIQDDVLRINYRGLSKNNVSSWSAGSEYYFEFKIGKDGKTAELIESSSTSDRITIDIESCRVSL